MTAARDLEYRNFAARHRVELPAQQPVQTGHLHVERIKADSELARRSGLSLAQFVRVYRNQTSDDPRPNKDLFELRLPAHLSLRDLTTRWNSVVRGGVLPMWKNSKPQTQQTRPSNYQSTANHQQAVLHHIIKGQRDGRYLVVEADLLDRWTNIFLSPIGTVQKSGAANRVINDYSFPDGASVNEYTDRSNFPVITYDPPREIARRIFELRRRFPGHPILVMLGDVSGAFRRIPVHAEHVHMFTFRFEYYIVVDLSCGFGWCGSLAFYSLAGSLINNLYESQKLCRGLSPLDPGAFEGNVWCDDHTCVEVDTGTRCFEANLALRKAMATVLGPTALNEEKITAWSTRTKALGLMWDTRDGSVSVPTEKISEARRQVLDILEATCCTLSVLNKLLGKLRYVSSCFPPARAFYQNIQVFAVGFKSPRMRRQIPPDVREDLRWFSLVLTMETKFNSIAVEHFARLEPPSRHVWMDASYTGLCVLEPQLRQFIRLKFSEAEKAAFATSKQENSINVRELMSAALAVLHWGPAWAATGRDRTHICVWIDNTSAVAWLAKRSSRHPTARLYNRLISVSEFRYSLTCSEAHIAGEENVMADAGSRAWREDHPLYAVWTNLSDAWTQVQVVPPFDNLSSLWATLSVDMLSLVQPPENTTRTGGNGVISPINSGGRRGSRNLEGPPTDS